MAFGRKLDTQVRQWIVGGRVEPEKMRPFLLDGEKLANAGVVVDSRPMGTMWVEKVFSSEATVALLENPNLPV